MANILLQISYSLATIENAVHQFWQCVYQYRVFAFSGNMGAGKTTFIQALCRYLKVEDHVSSPTFALINEYCFEKDGLMKTIYHMDWYRIRDAEEAINAGIEDAIGNKQAICFVEWAENVPELMPHSYIRVEITPLSEDVRQLTVLLQNS
ncbi:MAG: tRNA (adenosine(37)-N6)-threonylcarbamoyltransferase complex ATPase subunit type 1 TsaE [Bacteroidetes bacterium]|nr:tRNA (adenosine(37)-N6)-threonylcarbamoyltransferase complex ATPase subunit type 1 TsaE [Bacteroidota bacterium]MBS1741028.1 tRNA (adenosine(37)-N6)-threonylcarbamoyltransferase complex ATPase subunit type 1 TsaE [Bacteroidota bacterium]MBS1777032.1 tRNA (adenosine(37)-N6)-threonylcarbamoyltransferase complex ATPase subunit type 1 TsaE [Bacteroidota bacterium]